MRNTSGLTVRVCEIFKSVQGESSFAGLPCLFIRLSGCVLRCSYCDTRYSYEGGRDMTIGEITSGIAESRTPLVELTGGEPLMQPNSHALIDAIIAFQRKHAALFPALPDLIIETSGALPIEKVNKRAVLIMDIKLPSSGSFEKMRMENLNFLKPRDEVKFVVGSRKDYETARAITAEYGLESRCHLLFSTVFGKIKPATLVAWMLRDRINARFQLQAHKYIWPPDMRGV